MRNVLILAALVLGLRLLFRPVGWVYRWWTRDRIIDTLIKKPIMKFGDPYDYDQAVAAKARRVTSDQLRRQAARIDMLEDLAPAESDQGPTERVRAFRRRAR